MVARTLPLLAPEGMQIKASPAIDQIPHYNADVQAKRIPDAATALGEAIRAADGVIIITPEYNYSVPGVLKNAIDWLSRLEDQPFAGKPVLLQSVSGGALGGARMQYHLRQVMVFVEALVFTRPEVFIGPAASKFDDDLKLTDQPTRDIIKRQLGGFETFIRKVGGK
jgi:chromate reductase